MKVKMLISFIILMSCVGVFVQNRFYFVDEFKVVFLDIGQGDATYIDFGNGQDMLVDCAKDNIVLEALGRVMKFWDRELDYLLITHPDLDHYGGCIDVLRRLKVKNIIYTGFIKEGDAGWDTLLYYFTKEDANYIEIDKRQTWKIADNEIEFLYPDHSVKENLDIPGLGKGKSNDTSIVFILKNDQTRFLFSGDAEEKLERYLVNTYSDQLDIDILKVGHHGSDTSSIEEFIEVTSPEVAIISVGAENNFGHPSKRVISRLERKNVIIVRTDITGDYEIKKNSQNKNYIMTP